MSIRALRRLVFVGSLLFFHCAKQPDDSGAATARTSALFSDAAHGGNPHFYLLPPLVKATTYAGTFDATLSPIVTVCQLSGAACGATVAQFSMSSGTGAQVVRVDAANELYLVNWKTDQCLTGPCTLPDGAVYRVAVTVAGVTLGFADVAVIASQSEAKNVDGSTFALVDGRTLPVKFRIEQAAISVLPPSGGSVTVGPAGGTVATSDGAVSLVIPQGAVSSPVPITVAPSTNAPPTQAVGAIFHLGPEGTTFAAPVTLSVAYPPAGIPSGVAESSLRLSSSQAGGPWVEAPGASVDTTAHVATGSITHFSDWAVLPAVTAVSVAPAVTTVVTGAGAQLTATSVPANHAVTWSSSSPAATVDASGFVTGVSAGAATITATNGVSATATVRVIPVAPAITSPASGTSTTNGVMKVTGTATVGAAVNLFDNGTAVQTTADASGTFSIIEFFSIGSHSLTASQMVNGETSYASGPVSITILPVSSRYPGCLTDGTCSAPQAPASCTVDTDCSAGFCVGNHCLCGADKDCNGGFCVGNACYSLPPPVPCANPGDLACVSGATCCGGLTGGCVNLLIDPSHCGSCFNDCGSYYTDCTPNTNCTPGCSTDADCTAHADGSCAFARVTNRNDVECTIDSQCTLLPGAKGKCVAGTCAYACALDSECSEGGGPPGKCDGGWCYTGTCRYRTSTGLCVNGTCAVKGPGCTPPSVSELESASPPGASAVDFEHTSSNRCSAYVTSYRTVLPPGGPACGIERVDAGGSPTCYTANPSDLSRLSGVAVLPSGTDVLASYVDDDLEAAGMVHGLGAFASYRDVLASGFTEGAAPDPFDAVEFDTGPVGPRIDKIISTDSAWTAYYGNLVSGDCVDMGICKLAGLSASRVDWCNQPCTAPLGVCSPAPTCVEAPERVTALEIQPLKFAPPNLYHRYLIVGHGTTLSFLDLETRPTNIQTDLDLSNLNVYDPTTPAAVARGESTPTKILSIAAAPYGQIVIEVRGTGATPNRFLLNVDLQERMARSERAVEYGLQGFPPCSAAGVCAPSFACVDGFCLPSCGSCPAGTTCTNVGDTGTCESSSGGTRNVCCVDDVAPDNFGATDGRLTVMPDGQLLRFVPSADNLPATGWAKYRLTK
jgi:uncharacterized protein YjdB